MEEMKEIYRVQGSLQKDFVGQISYTVCLPETYRELDICFSFDKQHYKPEDLTLDRMEEIRSLCQREYQITLDDEKLRDLMLGEMKTEIHTLATLNGEFIGCVHRQLTTRHMHFTAGDATEGCIPISPIEGVLRVTLLSFNVLMDDTPYTLSVSAR
ncbi:MAG TPA: hypothetical protein IAA57_10770 [Candidatus Pullilachnospira intestinigallinarum]|nr:hypothetical protein [Candidatus Pullilachnospira intestinigallinarum]